MGRIRELLPWLLCVVLLAGLLNGLVSASPEHTTINMAEGQRLALVCDGPLVEHDYRPSEGHADLECDEIPPTPTEVPPTPTDVPPTSTPEPTATEVPASPHSVLFSLSSSRSNPAALHGATVSGNIYPFVPAETIMDAVTFYLDGALVRQENNSPYDFGGGSSSADPWDTRQVADGEHVIRAVVTYDDGSTSETTATFNVANGTAQPTPTEPPATPTEPDPTPTEVPPTPTEPAPTPTDVPAPPGGITLVPTFHSISVYVGYSGGGATLPVEYRVAGGAWQQGHPLDVDGGEARGSLVELVPDTLYEVRVEGQTATVKTRSDATPVSSGAVIDVADAAAFQAALQSANPGDVIRLAPGTYVGPFTLTRDGTPENYLTIDGQGAAVLSGNAGAVANILTLDNADHVLLTGLTVRDAGRNLISLLNGSDGVYIEDNQLIEPAYGQDTDLSDVAAAIHLRDGSRDAVIRDNLFHRNTVMTTKHSFPALFTWKAGEGLIVAGNTVTGGFEDSFRWGPEDSTTDSKSRDIDIYDNLIDGACFDDGIQPEGVAINVRVWGNTVTHCYVAMAFAPTIEGPLYVFRNVVIDNVHPVRGGSGAFKLGDEDDGRRGRKYLYHNTLILNAPVGTGTVFKQTNAGLGNVVSRNNIAIGSKYIAELGCDLTCDMDYDAVWTDDSSRFIEYRSQKFWSLAEWCATYGNGCNGLTVDARLSLGADLVPLAGSPLVDAGVVIPGFSAVYNGDAPDIGAFEQ